MGRPVTFKLEVGEVIFKNVPKEKSDELIKLLKGEKVKALTNMIANEPVSIHEDNSEKELISEYAKPDNDEDAPELKDLALGATKVGDHWKVVRIKYDILSGATEMSKVEDVGKSKYEAFNEFKIATMNELKII